MIRSKCSYKFCIRFSNIVIVLAVFLLVSAWYRLDTHNQHKTFRDISLKTKEGLKAQGKRPTILVWAKPRAKRTWILPDTTYCGGGCDISWNRSDFNVSNAVIFFFQTISSTDLPDASMRKRDQAFVWWTHESPSTTINMYSPGLKYFTDYFNWTMTYRRDSDVIGHFVPATALDYVLYRLGRFDEMYDQDFFNHQTMSEADFHDDFLQIMERKTNLVSWVVSDCNFGPEATIRFQFARSLKEQIDIHTFGQCTKILIPRNNSVLLETIAKYKFYLAFENSVNCTDYITEKFFYNSLLSGTVPIVRGPLKDDVTKLAPEGSFIHVDDFENAVDLANYLKYLDQNVTAYMEYFEWWKSPGANAFPRFGLVSGRVEKSLPSYLEIQDAGRDFEVVSFCHLCRKLNNGDHINTSKTINDLHKFWLSRDRKKCSAPSNQKQAAEQTDALREGKKLMRGVDGVKINEPLKNLRNKQKRRVGRND